MKKLTSVLLMLAMLLSCAAYAAQGKLGEQVSVTLYYSSNAAVAGISIDFDSSALTLAHLEASGGSTNGNRVGLMNPNGIGSGSIVCTFDISASATPGIYTVTGSVFECYNLDETNGTCSISSESITIVCKEHKLEIRNARPATCTDEGYTGDEACTVCNNVIAYGKSIEKLEHKTELQNVKPTTCTEDGYSGDEVCTLCKNVIAAGKRLEKLGHKTEIQNAKPATCSEDGYTGDEVCTVCEDVISAGKSIEKFGHKTENRNAKPAICTEDGYTGDEVCTVCDEIITSSKVIPALSATKTHTEGAWETALEPTFDADGKRIQRCTVCDTILKEEVIQKLLKGDVNLDGKVSLVDALYALQHSIGAKSLKGYAFKNADVNEDGKVNMLDALRILKLAI